MGRQVPATFRDPSSGVGHPGPTGTVPGTNPGGDQSGNFWFAGGGGGASDDGAPTAGGGGGAANSAASPYAGAGYGSYAPNPGTAGEDAVANSGSGGGGAGSNNTPIACKAGSGGSGIVLIAYDS